MTEFDVITKAQHYNSHPSGIECIEIARYLTGDWFNTFKYVFRADHKNGRQDLEKALYYAEDAERHVIPIDMLPAEVSTKLAKVIESEIEASRIDFFLAIWSQNTLAAVSSLRRMLFDNLGEVVD